MVGKLCIDLFLFIKNRKNREFLCEDDLGVGEQLVEFFSNIYWVMMWKRD